jgi:hypothetical protein
MTDLPEFYFRTRENGAAVYRVDTENRERRLELNQIAVVNLKKEDIRAHGDHDLTEAETAAIRAWLKERTDTLARRTIDDIHRTVEHLNLTAQWAQSQASAEDLDAVTDALLLAMHDLRGVLVRKKSERMR